MNLDLTDVALFVRVCATRNLSAAGREFSLSPAASSARMAQLERQLGARLLHRTTRQIALTQDGETFLERAVALLDAAEQARASVGAGREPQGLLRVAASVSFGRLHLMPWLPAFMERYPGLQLDLRLSDRVIDLAANGIDVTIRNGPLHDSALIARVLAPSRLLLVAAPAYLARHGTPQRPQELADHQCLVLEGVNPWNFRDTDGSLIKVRVGGRMRSDNGEAMRDAALAGLGIALQSTWAVYQQLKSGALVPLLAAYPMALNSVVSAQYLNRNFLPPKTQAFIDYFAARFGPAPYWDEGLPRIGN
ncbi:LysR family transcriptional regulator [Massilia antarctica]|uniref:LysR family transcriptional regulator n=1 Tax=Massilia antarctica TaxID=2765360 RepID=A0AA48WGK3_9BURK|nr:LysR family transcriptional regulator [Massilia antarctica]QPI51224.1 LysR family transcriptional regulator [Massilia antarctica]